MGTVLAFVMLFTMLPVPAILAADSNDTLSVTEQEFRLSGSGSVTDPYLIKDLEDLKGFRDTVNAGNDYSGQYVKLTADIDLSGEVWVPIGTSIYDKKPTTEGVKMFAGNFDGGNHTITGLTAEGYVPEASETASTEYSFGLFGYVYGANIANVKLANVNINGGTRVNSVGSEVYGSGVAALIGYYYVADGKECVIENCHVLNGSVSASNNMGGLIGFIDSQVSVPQNVNITIKNCSNAANVTSEAREAGGIVGLLNASRTNYDPTMAGRITFDGCTNTGDITTLAGGGSTFAGGILGKDQNEYSNQQLKIVFDGCTNAGTITVYASGETHVAGLGTSFYSTGAWLVADNSSNTGDIVVVNPENATDIYAGGLLGYAGVMDVINCTSTGTVANGNKYIGSVSHMAFVDGISDFNDSIGGYTYFLNGGSSPAFDALVDDVANWGGNFNVLVKTANHDNAEFMGWYDNAELNGEAYTVLDPNVRAYYAKWKLNLPSGSNSPAYTKEVDGYVRVWGEGGGNAKESFVLKLYSEDTLLATTELNNIGGIIDGDVYVTWNFFFPSSNDEYWTTTWEEGHPNSDAQPTKVELYIDGALVAVTNAMMSGADGLNPVVWAELGGVASIPEVIEIRTWEDLKALDARVEGGDRLEGVTVKLMNDIDLYEMGTDDEPVSFNPIGANTAYFKGTFDGQGYTIRNMYQSGWALGYDWDNYGTIGLFAYLWDATVKNLTIENAECFVEGGNVAGIAGCAWGDCTFENITIKNSTYATYNNRAAGIVGYTGGEGTMTFKDITVDEDTVIAALWGSYDCTLGGVVGSTHTNNVTKYVFEDVTVACKLDCYNDVTASYKWYSYRMCGMLIGSMKALQDGTTDVDPRDTVTLKNVKITIGEWANQTYIWDDSLSKGCQRVEAGYSYDGVDVSQYPDAEVETIGFNTIIGGPQSQKAGYYGSDITKLEALEGFEEQAAELEVEDIALEIRSRVAKVGDEYFDSLEAAFAAAQDGETIVLLADAAPVLSSQRAITKASVIDLGGNTLTLTEDDLYFGTTTFKNGTIVVDPSVTPSTAVFWMFANQTLTFDNVKLVATGVTGTYLIGLDGNNADLNLLNGSEILVENTTALDLDIICVNSSEGNDIVIDNSKVNVTNLDGRVFFRGNYTVKGNSDIDLVGITKAGFRIEAGQSLSVEDTATVDIVGEPRDGGIHLTDTTAAYTKADTATVNCTVNAPVVVYAAYIGEQGYETVQAAINAAQTGDTVVISAGEYDAINISNKSITIQGTVGDNGELLTTIKGGNPAITGHSFNGTIKNLKIVDAWKVMYAEPAGNVTVDNVYVTGATYGFHLVAYSEGLTWTIQNSYMDLAWANSFGVYGGDAAIVIKGNEFVSTNPYYPEYGAIHVNSFLPNVTVEENIFRENARIYIDGSVTDTSNINISKNYHADGVENAFADDADGVTVAIKKYYTGVDEDGNLTGLVEIFDAEINGTGYESLQAAVDAAADGDTITLLTDVVLTDTLLIPADKNIVLDLAGKTISQTKACTESYEMIANNGSLTITGNGIISFTDTGAGDPEATWGAYTIRNSGTLVVENGTIENLSVQNQAGQPFAHTTLAIFQYSGSTTINGGKISTPNYRSLRLWSGDVTINGGELDGQVWVHCVNGTAKLTINGGEFSPNGNDGSSVFVNNSGYEAELNVTGGTFATRIGADVPAELNGDLITGGTFTAAAANGTNLALLGENIEFVENSDGSFGVELIPPVAMIGETSYTSLQTAVNEAADGDTITLLTDVVLTDTLIIPADAIVTLNLNGKTVSMEHSATVTANHTMISNNGKLTITGDGGKLSYKYTGGNLGTTYSANTVTSNPGSVLTVLGGTIENLTYDSAIIAYAIDGLTNGGAGDVTVEIKGGSVTSKRQAVRIFAYSTTNTGTLNISGGEITGRVIVQNANTKENKAALEITGGTFNANEYKTDVLYVGGSNGATIDMNAVVSGGTFNGEITSSIPERFIFGGTFTVDPSAYLVFGKTWDAATGGIVEGYVISNAEDLLAFAAAVNAGDSFDGKTVKLGADINLSGINWTPIGNTTNYFRGTFDGQNHTISNMTVNIESTGDVFAGLFGAVKKATVKNLTLKDVNIDVIGGKVRAAAVVGIAHSNSENRTDATINFENITVDGCTIIAEAKSGSAMTGGIVGYCYPANMKGIAVSDLTINGKAAGQTLYASAMAAYVCGQNISNNGQTRAAFTVEDFVLNNIVINAEANSVLAGGYTGEPYYGYITFKNGTINGIKMVVRAHEAFVGGLVGYFWRSDNGHTVTDVNITGIDFDVTTDYLGETRIGGMVGTSQSVVSYTDCSVAGTITERCSDSENPVNYHAKVGGFVGRAYTWAQSYTNCTADVDITASHVAGGFVGNHITNASYTNCEAKGDVTANIAGGFAGRLTENGFSTAVTFDGCKVSGNVTGTNVAGGFIGSTVDHGWAAWTPDAGTAYAKAVTLKDCTITGAVTSGTDYCAGVVGEAILSDGVDLTMENVTYSVTPSYYPAKVYEVSTKAELAAAVAAAQDGDTILLIADIDYGTDHLEIAKEITLDLGGKTLTTRARNYGLALKNGCTVTNGTLNHAGTVAAIKVWNAAEISDLNIDVTGTSSSGNNIGGIVIQANSVGVGVIRNVNIYSTSGQGIANGIETYNCGDAAEPVIGSMENVTIDAVGTAMNISAPCGTATNCTFNGGVSGIEIWIKGTYSATLDLVNCEVEGGEQAVFAHDEFSSSPDVVNSGELTLTADDSTVFTSENGVQLVKSIARAEDVILPPLDEGVAAVNGKHYASLDKAFAAATAGQTVRLLTDTQIAALVVKSGVTVDLAGNNLTADYVVTFKDAAIIDSNSQIKDAQLGALIAPKDLVRLEGQNGNYVPVWNGEAYNFAYLYVQVSQKLSGTDDTGAVLYGFRYDFTGNRNGLEELVANDDSVLVKVNLTWTTSTGNISNQSFTMPKEKALTLLEGTEKAIQLTVTGLSGIQNINICVILESEATKVAVEGGVFTVSLAD
ncbi:MAG: hypothetical protein IJZ08_07545 [Clostridia bacterium]|nr:hypothetical protein [Clostridia bacterium]